MEPLKVPIWYISALYTGSKQTIRSLTAARSWHCISQLQNDITATPTLNWCYLSTTFDRLTSTNRESLCNFLKRILVPTTRFFVTDYLTSFVYVVPHLERMPYYNLLKIQINERWKSVPRFPDILAISLFIWVFPMKFLTNIGKSGIPVNRNPL